MSKGWTEFRGWPACRSIAFAHPGRGLRVALVSVACWVSGALAQTGTAPAADPESTPTTLTMVYTPYDEWTEGESPTSTTLELDDIYRPKDPTIDVPLFDGPIDRFLAATSSLEESTGLRLGFAYTTIFQQASGGPGQRRGASGDLDIMGVWTLIGRGTANTG